MKILHLVLANKEHPWGLTREVANNTYLKIKSDYVIDTIFYFGSSNNEIILDGKDLILDTQQNYNLNSERTYKAIKWAYENYDFDLIYRSCESSYIDYTLLDRQVTRLDKFYAGLIGKHMDILFCSGSGFFLSKDLVEIYLNSKELIQPYENDDVTIGKILKRNNIYPTNLIRHDIDKETIIDPTGFQYRCKRSSDYSTYYEDIKESFERIYKIKLTNNLS